MTPPPVFIGSDIYRRQGFGDNHPLAIPRVGLVMETAEALGWFPDGWRDSPAATAAELERFHAPDYLAALERVERDGAATEHDRDRYHLGTRENPIFPGMNERARTSCGGSIAAAKVALAGGVAFNPAGGTHHGMPARAHGFCYLNDPVMAILTLLEGDAAPVFYLDLDAHHGDGVEMAFKDDPRVVTCSIHEVGRWPKTGQAHGPAGSGVYDFPVPGGFHDAELAFLMTHAVLPLIDAVRPQAAVITCGADALAGDPLSRLSLGNTALWNAVGAVVERVPGTVVLGGGGYNPWTVARCWAGLWGHLNGWRAPTPLPEPIRARFAELDCDLVDEEDRNPLWFETLEDAPTDAPVRAEIVALAEELPAPPGKAD